MKNKKPLYVIFSKRNKATLIYYLLKLVEFKMIKAQLEGVDYSVQFFLLLIWL